MNIYFKWFGGGQMYEHEMTVKMLLAKLREEIKPGNQ